MELMTIKDALELIENTKNIYREDTTDIKIWVGARELLTFDEFVKRIEEIDIEEKYFDMVQLSIEGMTLLNKWDRLDADTINIHTPVRRLDMFI